MSYAAYLRELLKPLQVYDLGEKSFSGASLAALGAELDALDAYASLAQREALVMTAEESGLSRMETLFPYPALGETAEERRAALAGFVQISGDSFTPQALSRCLGACGVACLVEESETPFVVSVSFPGVRGEPENFSLRKAVIEDILPCHLQVDYALVWCTWQETEDKGITWQDLQQMSFYQWAVLEP